MQSRKYYHVLEKPYAYNYRVEGTEDRAACISKNGSKDLVDYTL
jgi:hypothetical protein